MLHFLFVYLCSVFCIVGLEWTSKVLNSNFNSSRMGPDSALRKPSYHKLKYHGSLLGSYFSEISV